MDNRVARIGKGAGQGRSHREGPSCPHHWGGGVRPVGEGVRRRVRVETSACGRRREEGKK